jgi:hypothetical protein
LSATFDVFKKNFNLMTKPAKLPLIYLIDKIRHWQKLNFSILAIDYRGHGRSEGKFPSESQVYADAKAAWEYVRSEQVGSVNQESHG